MKLHCLPILNVGMSGGVEIIPPVLSDGNTMAWFDYLQNITKDGSDFVSVWGDKSGSGNDLLQAVGTNQPLWTADGVLFDGVDNFMKCVAFTLVQPEFIYMVVKHITVIANGRFFDGKAAASGHLTEVAPSPDVRANAGANSASNSNFILNTYGIVRLLFNGAASKLQINETSAVTGNFGSNDMGGFALGARSDGALQSNIEVKEVIIRKIADTAPNEQIIYDYLKSKYSL